MSEESVVLDNTHGEIRLAVSALDAVLGDDLLWHGPGAEALQECMDGEILPGLAWPRRFDQLSAHGCKVVLDDTKLDRVLALFSGDQAAADRHLAKCRDALAAGILMPLYPIDVQGPPGARVTGRYLHEMH